MTTDSAEIQVDDFLVSVEDAGENDDLTEVTGVKDSDPEENTDIEVIEVITPKGRGRGRPKKSEKVKGKKRQGDLDPQVPKKARGRPPKDAVTDDANTNHITEEGQELTNCTDDVITAQKRGRGRPPKADGEKFPKKYKSAEDNAQSDDVTEEPDDVTQEPRKGRGRPRKDVSESAGSVTMEQKKGRGRAKGRARKESAGAVSLDGSLSPRRTSRQITQVDYSEYEDEYVPRKRTKWRGSDEDSDDFSEEYHSPTRSQPNTNSKRGRGRPRKNSNTNARMTSARMYNDEDEHGDTDEEEYIPQSTKSRAASGEAPPSDSNTPSGGDNDDSVSPIKYPGKPPKKKSAKTVTGKKGRGRPPKQTVVDGNTSLPEEGFTTADAVMSPKRGRGRPPKQLEAVGENDVHVSVKKGRGRPKKEYNDAPSKKGRGRPPKKQKVGVSDDEKPSDDTDMPSGGDNNALPGETDVDVEYNSVEDDSQDGPEYVDAIQG